MAWPRGRSNFANFNGVEAGGMLLRTCIRDCPHGSTDQVFIRRMESRGLNYFNVLGLRAGWSRIEDRTQASEDVAASMRLLDGHSPLGCALALRFGACSLQEELPGALNPKALFCIEKASRLILPNACHHNEAISTTVGTLDTKDRTRLSSIPTPCLPIVGTAVRCQTCK